MVRRHSICIAIDGEAAAGKSTIGQMLAERMGYLYFDTGVMYRAVTWAAQQRGVDVTDEMAVTALAESLDIRVTPPTRAPCAPLQEQGTIENRGLPQDGRQYTVRADGVDVTWATREPTVDGAVSIVAAYPGVRRALAEQQRRVARAQDVVMVGRDIGTFVMPDADLKIYMRASAPERARRRCAERQARGDDGSYDEVLASMQQRDYLDSHRAVAPLRAAADAVMVDTDGLGAEEVLARVAALVDERSLPCAT